MWLALSLLFLLPLLLFPWTAIRDTTAVFGSTSGVGLAFGLLAVFICLPLGSVWALLLSIAAIGFARRERRRLCANERPAEIPLR